MSKPSDIPQDVVALVGEARGLHLDLHNRVRAALVGREVVVKTKVNGIANRRGVIMDTILTYDVSFGVDLYRLDGRSGCLDRLWFGLRALEFTATPAIRGEA